MQEVNDSVTVSAGLRPSSVYILVLYVVSVSASSQLQVLSAYHP